MEIDYIARLQRYKYAVQLHEQYERDDKARIYNNNKLEKLWGKCNIAKVKGYAKKPVRESRRNTVAPRRRTSVKLQLPTPQPQSNSISHFIIKPV